MRDIQRELYDQMQDIRDNPEGLSVPIVGTDDEALARQAAPLVAARLFPDRDLGPVLWLEHLGPQIWEAVVADRGLRSYTPRGISVESAIAYGRRASRRRGVAAHQ